MAIATFRLPAEWERQSATLLAWPHEGTDWADDLDAIRREYRELIATIVRHQPVLVLTAPGDASAEIALAGVREVNRIEAPFNDTWCRDYGPVTLVSGGRRLAMDFHFNGWGGKHRAELDNRVNTLLSRNPLFDRLEFRQSLFELEGGAIDGDGQGRVLINWHCLRARHPHLSQAEVRHELALLLNAGDVIGIDMPPMPGDDTDGHIDTLARFLAPDVIVYQEQADSTSTNRLREQLQALDQGRDRTRELIALPVAEGVDPNLPASYANFLFVNGACLVPSFGSDSDEVARGILADALPERNVLPVPARALIRQSGGPHCATMHIPAPLQ